jgi:hypothetical protein
MERRNENRTSDLEAKNSYEQVTQENPQEKGPPEWEKQIAQREKQTLHSRLE